MRQPVPPTRKKEESPITPLPRCPECGERHVELSQVPLLKGTDWRRAWYCIDCCFSWFQ